jgi:hypothetical protein
MESSARTAPFRSADDLLPTNKQTEHSPQVYSFILGATTIYEFWPAQQLTSIYFYPVLTFSN